MTLLVPNMELITLFQMRSRALSVSTHPNNSVSLESSPRHTTLTARKSVSLDSPPPIHRETDEDPLNISSQIGK